jgi:hypothetical protein
MTPAPFVAALDTSYDCDEAALRWFEHMTTHGTQRIIRRHQHARRPEHARGPNSAPRMDRMDRVLRLAGAASGLQLVVQDRRPAEDVREAMSLAPARAPVESLDSSDPQIIAAQDQTSRAHDQARLDQAIPALAGATPRETAVEATRLPDLIRLRQLRPRGPQVRWTQTGYASTSAFNAQPPRQPRQPTISASIPLLTSGSDAKRSQVRPSAGSRQASRSFALKPAPHPSRGNVSRRRADTKRKSRARGDPRTRS